MFLPKDAFLFVNSAFVAPGKQRFFFLPGVPLPFAWMSLCLSRLAQQVVALVLPGAQEIVQRGDLLGLVGRRIQAQRRAPPPVVSNDSAAQIRVLCMTLELALIPRAARRSQTKASSCAS